MTGDGSWISAPSIRSSRGLLLGGEGMGDDESLPASSHLVHPHQDLMNLERKRIINLRTSLMVPWIRIGLPVQQTGAQSLVWKIPHAAEQLSL